MLEKVEVEVDLEEVEVEEVEVVEMEVEEEVVELDKISKATEDALDICRGKNSVLL